MLSTAARWGVVFLVWAAVGGLLTLELYLSLSWQEPSLSFAMVAFGQYMRVLLWALLTPVVFWLQGRFPINVGTFTWTLPLHVVFAVLAMVLIYLVRFALAFFVLEPEMDSFWLHAITGFHGRNMIDIAIYAVIYGVGFTLGLVRSYREARVHAVQLEKDLAQAEMKALKAQLHPHFLFNTLNTISAMVRDNQNEEAVALIGKLGALLRLALETKGQQEVALKHELDFLRRYLEIQKMRFSDRLEVVIEVATEALDAMVPNLVLQPIVENAVIHGFSARTGRGCIEVRIEVENGRLRAAVRDEGPGFPPAFGLVNSGRGIGLSNTRGRLQRLFGNDATLTLGNRSEGGAEVLLDMPLRRAAPHMPVEGGVG